MSNLRHRFKYDQSILEVAESIVSHLKGTRDPVKSIEEIQEDVEWLRWRINECWDPPENLHTQHYDDLVRMLAAEAVDLYDHFVGKAMED